MLEPGWSSSLRDLLGAPLTEVDRGHLQALPARQVREAAELDFKESLYGASDADKRELAADIASMRNGRGGVIVLGVKDENGVAVAAPQVDLSEPEELRTLQIVAELIAPHAAFETIRVEAGGGRGFYLLAAPPSPLRPHSGRVSNGLRYPRRDGPRKRWLTEPEVADMYRDRFRSERQQADRLAQITDETIDRLDRGEAEGTLDPSALEPRAWLVLSLVPNGPGSMTMSFPVVGEMQQWAHKEHTNDDLMDGFFSELPPKVGVSVQRYTLTSPADRATPARYPYVVCCSDGAGSAAFPLRLQPRTGGQPVLLAPHFVFATVKALRLLGRHAVRNAGAFNDATIEARVLCPHIQLGYIDGDGLVEDYPNALLVREAGAHVTLPLESLAGDAQDVLTAARLTLMDVFNSFGVAEIPFIAADGTLRVIYFPSGYEVGAWAERHGVATTEEQAPEQLDGRLSRGLSIAWPRPRRRAHHDHDGLVLDALGRGFVGELYRCVVAFYHLHALRRLDAMASTS